VKREVALRLIEVGAGASMQVAGCGILLAVQGYPQHRQAGDPATVVDVLRADTTHFSLSATSEHQCLTLNVAQLARSARGIDSIRQWISVAFGRKDWVNSVKREVALHLLELGEGSELDIRGCTLPAVSGYHTLRSSNDPVGPITILCEDSEHFTVHSGSISLNYQVLLQKAAAACWNTDGRKESDGDTSSQTQQAPCGRSLLLLVGCTIPNGLPTPPQKLVTDKQLWTFKSAMCRLGTGQVDLIMWIG
jgi:hypothetical protein